MRTQRGDVAACILASLIATCVMIASARTADPRDVDYPYGGVQLGNGWSSISANKTPGACIDFQLADDPAEDRNAAIRRVVDKEQLNRTLNVSAEFQAKQILGATASAKASYANALELSSESVHLSFVAKVLRGATYAAPRNGTSGIALKPFAVALAKTNPSKFLQHCGDSYVSAIHSGGELNAYLSFVATSRDERETISAMMTGSVVGFNGSVTANKTMAEYKANSKLTILIHSAGGSGVPIPVSEVQLLQALRELPENAKSAPKKYSISLSRYDELLEWPAGKVEVQKFRQMERLVRQYQNYLGLYNDMAAIIANPSHYVVIGKLSVANVRQLQDGIHLTTLPALKARMQECAQLGQCEIPASAVALDYEFRVNLPVKRASFPEDERLISLTKAHADQVEVDKKVAGQIYQNMGGTSSGGGFDTGSTLVTNPAKAVSTQAVADAAKAIQSAMANYPEAVANAMIDQWINILSSYRCATNPEPGYCLSNAQKDTYATKIKSLTL